MTPSEKEFWECFYSEEEAKLRHNRNINRANTVIFILTVVVAVVWVLVKL